MMPHREWISTQDALKYFSSVKRMASGWMARCPAHDDRTPSLHISEGKDGATIMYCHAQQCEFDNIVAGAGLTGYHLGARDKTTSNSNGHVRYQVEAEYIYRKADGRLHYRVAKKVNPANPKDKQFPQSRSDGNGGWVSESGCMNGVERVLYRLPELLAADPREPVFLPEGEKDVETIRGMGLVATCNSGGAGKLGKGGGPDYYEPLRGCDVLVPIDSDEAGRKHGADVARKLTGIAKSIKVFELPGVGEGGDVSDWKKAGGTREQLLEIAATSPEWKPDNTTVKQAETASSVPTIEQPEGRTDAANAQRFAADHGAYIHWIKQWLKFTVYDGRRWGCDDSALEARAKQSAAKQWNDLLPMLAANAPNAKAVSAFVKASNSATGILATLRLARSEPGIPIDHTALDQHPFLFNVQNGTVDLETGRLRPFNQRDMLTKMSNVTFDPAATCPTWERFLHDIFAGNLDLILFIQRVVGYSLTASVMEHILLFLWGTGRNGKTTLAHTLENILGEYAASLTSEMLMTAQGERHPTEVCDLHGRRLAIATEIEDGRRFAESLIKRLTGSDTLKGRRMREDHWEFQPTHKLWVLGNHKPQIRGTDDAIWERVALVPFQQQYLDDDPRTDRALPEKLAKEHSGIFNWALAGCLDWQKHGLSRPEIVRQATAEYRHESDLVGQFIDECCHVGEHYQAPATPLFERFERWGGQANQTAFGRRLTERGFISERITSGSNKGRKVWLGIGLASDNERGSEQ